MAWHVYSDFDNTISLGDVTTALLQLHAPPSWLDIEAQWERGEFGSRICMERQMALIDASAAELDALADSVDIDPGFIEFAEFCAASGVPLTILSDGLDYFIHRIMARYNLSYLPVVAGHFTQTGARSWQLTAPNALPICASGAVTCKCAAAQRNNDFILYIGDGRSDFCAASKRATLTLAKASLLTHCQNQQLPHLPFHGFEQAQMVLQNLMNANSPPATSEKKIHVNRA